MSSFLGPAQDSEAVRELLAEDERDLGYVMNATRLWSHVPALKESLFDLMGEAARTAGLTFRERGILVTACASTLGDSYCSLAWGGKLAGVAGAELAGSVLRADDDLPTPKERALAAWARRIAGDPNATTATDLDALRTAGYGDAEILAVSLFVGLRLAFSSVNDAVGARPDPELVAALPDEVRTAVTFGRPVAE